MKTFLWLPLLFLASCALAQDDLKPGFQLLNSGKFTDGANFFKTYLTTRESSNRTALLCYGRGIGLLGSPAEAQHVFSELLQQFPGDFEIGLNWAESLMWAKQYSNAKTYYETLIAQQPASFAAVLGYANALSSLHDYGFKYQLPIIYFSPRRFTSLELFGQLENLSMPRQKALYQLSVAGSMQQIEREAWQPTYRLSLHLGIRPVEQAEIMIYGQKSNITTSTVTG